MPHCESEERCAADQEYCRRFVPGIVRLCELNHQGKDESQAAHA
jgi:hypothetical protein